MSSPFSVSWYERPSLSSGEGSLSLGASPTTPKGVLKFLPVALADRSMSLAQIQGPSSSPSVGSSPSSALLDWNSSLLDAVDLLWAISDDMRTLLAMPMRLFITELLGNSSLHHCLSSFFADSLSRLLPVPLPHSFTARADFRRAHEEVSGLVLQIYVRAARVENYEDLFASMGGLETERPRFPAFLNSLPVFSPVFLMPLVALYALSKSASTIVANEIIAPLFLSLHSDSLPSDVSATPAKPAVSAGGQAPLPCWRAWLHAEFVSDMEMLLKRWSKGPESAASLSFSAIGSSVEALLLRYGALSALLGLHGSLAQRLLGVGGLCDDVIRIVVLLHEVFLHVFTKRCVAAAATAGAANEAVGKHQGLLAMIVGLKRVLRRVVEQLILDIHYERMHIVSQSISQPVSAAGTAAAASASSTSTAATRVRPRRTFRFAAATPASTSVPSSITGIPAPTASGDDADVRSEEAFLTLLLDLPSFSTDFVRGLPAGIQDAAQPQALFRELAARLGWRKLLKEWRKRKAAEHAATGADAKAKANASTAASAPKGVGAKPSQQQQQSQTGSRKHIQIDETRLQYLLSILDNIRRRDQQRALLSRRAGTASRSTKAGNAAGGTSSAVTTLPGPLPAPERSMSAEDRDAKVSALRAIFDDFSVEVAQMILTHYRWGLDEAVKNILDNSLPRQLQDVIAGKAASTTAASSIARAAVDEPGKQQHRQIAAAAQTAKGASGGASRGLDSSEDADDEFSDYLRRTGRVAKQDALDEKAAVRDSLLAYDDPSEAEAVKAATRKRLKRFEQEYEDEYQDDYDEFFMDEADDQTMDEKENTAKNTRRSTQASATRSAPSTATGQARPKAEKYERQEDEEAEEGEDDEDVAAPDDRGRATAVMDEWRRAEKQKELERREQKQREFMSLPSQERKKIQDAAAARRPQQQQHAVPEQQRQQPQPSRQQSRAGASTVAGGQERSADGILGRTDGGNTQSRDDRGDRGDADRRRGGQRQPKQQPVYRPRGSPEPAQQHQHLSGAPESSNTSSSTGAVQSPGVSAAKAASGAASDDLQRQGRGGRVQNYGPAGGPLSVWRDAHGAPRNQTAHHQQQQRHGGQPSLPSNYRKVDEDDEDDDGDDDAEDDKQSQQHHVVQRGQSMRPQSAADAQSTSVAATPIGGASGQQQQRSYRQKERRGAHDRKNRAMKKASKGMGGLPG